MKFISFTLPIIPTAQKRPRFFSKGKYVGVYKDKTQIDNEDDVMQLLEKYIPETPIMGAIVLSVKAFMPVPKSKPQWWRDAAISGAIKHTKKPDLDNILKNIKDCMTKLSFYHDDNQIYKYYDTYKRYSVNPRWEIIMQEIEEPHSKNEYFKITETGE